MRLEIDLIGIVVPAHNEEALIRRCLTSLVTASHHESLHGEPVKIYVVLDACTDSSGAIARSLGVQTLPISAKNVGQARHVGAQAALKDGARWLAFTDADTVVCPNWLVNQLALKADAVCGTVGVEDWGIYGERMQRHFSMVYQDKNGHSHIHGANLGVSAWAYRHVGGFQSLQTSEDVALVKALTDAGVNVAWSCAPRVMTSVRADFRAPLGFGAALQTIELTQSWAGNTSAALM